LTMACSLIQFVMLVKFVFFFLRKKQHSKACRSMHFCACLSCSLLFLSQSADIQNIPYEGLISGELCNTLS
jgi:hypothetical protein